MTVEDNYVFTIAPSSDVMGFNHGSHTGTVDLFFLHSDGSTHGTIAGIAANVANALGFVITTVASGGSHPQTLGGVTVDVGTLSGRASVVLNGTYYLDNASTNFPYANSGIPAPTVGWTYAYATGMALAQAVFT